jgi:hypothetical protein
VQKDGVLKANDSIPEEESLYVSGQNLILNDVETNEMHLIIDGKLKQSPNSECHINLEAVSSCGAECLEALDGISEIEDFYRYWSDAANWPNGVVPA